MDTDFSGNRRYDKQYRDWLIMVQSEKQDQAEEADSFRKAHNEKWEQNGYLKYPNIYRIIGLNLLQLGKYEEALKKFEKALRIYNDDKIKFSDSFPILRPGPIRDGLRWKDQEQSDEEMLAWTYHDIGLCNAKIKNYLDAEKNYINAIESAKKSSEVKVKKILWGFYIELGLLYYEQGRYGKAEKQYERATNCCKAFQSDSCKTSSLLQQGMVNYKKLDYNSARNQFDEARESLAKEEMAQKKEEEMAQTKEEKAARNDRLKMERLRIDMTKAAILNNTARIEIDKDNYEYAEALLKEANKIYDNNGKKIELLVPLLKYGYKNNIASLYNNRGIIYHKQIMWDAAKKEYEKSLEYAKLAETYYNLGLIYKEEDQKNRAEKLMQEALRLNPKMDEAKQYLADYRGSKYNWWDWWFNSNPKSSRKVQNSSKNKAMMFIKENICCKKGFGFLLVFLNILMLVSLSAGIIYSTIQEMRGINENMVINQTNSSAVSNVSSASQFSMETRILMATLLIIMLLLPQIRSLGIGPAKLDLEPMTKGSSKEGDYGNSPK